MATYTYSLASFGDSDSTTSTSYTSYWYPKRSIALQNAIPPFSTINSATLTYSTTTSSSGKSSSYEFKAGYWSKNSTTFTLFSNAGTGTGINNTITSIVGSGTFDAGQALSAIGFRWRMKRSSLLSGTASRTVTMKDISIAYDYTPPSTILNLFYLHNNISEEAVFKTSSGFSQTTTFTTYLDGELGADGHSVIITMSNLDDYYAGFHPSYWTDGTNTYNIVNNTVTLSWDVSDTEKNFTLVFEPNSYTVNFWDNTKEPAVLISSMNCECGTTYSTPSFPQYESRAGYAVNPTGWIKSLTYNSTYNKICKASTSSNTLYYYAVSTSSSTYTVTQYSSFTDLSTIDGDTVNLYFLYVPIRYSITYRYRLSTASNYSTSTEYRVFEDGATTLSTLTSKTSLNTGYKWLNTTPNYWYTSEKTASTGYLPEGEQIASIASDYIGDINLYAYQVPIEYSVVRHIYDINGTEIDLNGAETLNCKYGTSYNRNTNLTFTTPTTIISNPIVKESYENKYNDAEYGFTLTTNNGVNTYTKESFTTTGVAMMKLIITAKAPCILTLILNGSCYMTYNRWFISKLDGDPLSTNYSVTDADSLLSYYFGYNGSSNFSNQQLKFFIDEGTHWLYIKYRRNTSSTSSTYTSYNSLNFTTSYETIRINQDIIGWYNSTQTINNTIGLPSSTSISNNVSSTTVTTIGPLYKEQLFTAINLSTPNFDLNSSFSNLTTTDGDIIHYYAYYVPGKQYITYQWLDNLGNKDIYQVESSSYIYGHTNGTIKNIPDYTPYVEDNVGTKQWYYYENNDLNL